MLDPVLALRRVALCCHRFSCAVLLPSYVLRLRTVGLIFNARTPLVISGYPFHSELAKKRSVVRLRHCVGPEGPCAQSDDNVLGSPGVELWANHSWRNAVGVLHRCQLVDADRL